MFVETGLAGRSWIDVEQVELLVVDDLEDMRVAADIQLRFFLLQDMPYFRHVMARIAPDMGHVDMDVLHLEKQVFGVFQPNDMVVDVAVNSPQRLKGCELFGSLNVSDVTGMP